MTILRNNEKTLTGLFPLKLLEILMKFVNSPSTWEMLLRPEGPTRHA